MGWMLKGLALIAGLVSLTLGFWPIWVPCFGYLGYTLWAATRRRSVYVIGRDADAGGGSGAVTIPSRRRSFKKRYVLAGALFVLALVAISAGGVYSPLVFFISGVAVALSGMARVGPRVASWVPVPDSIVLRRRWVPFSWVSVAEVKFATSKMARALSSTGNEILISAETDKVSVYLPIRVTALSAAGAERKALQRLRPLARRLSPKGAFVLPLEGEQASSRFDWSLERVETSLGRVRNGVDALNSIRFDALVLAPRGQVLRSAAAYTAARKSTDDETPAAAGAKSVVSIPGPGPRLRREPLLWEVLEVLDEKFQVDEPDPYTNFLSSVSATRGEGLGERLVGQGRDGSGTLLLSSLGTTEVQLTRPQLRAVMSAYG